MTYLFLLLLILIHLYHTFLGWLFVQGKGRQLITREPRPTETRLLHRIWSKDV